MEERKGEGGGGGERRGVLDLPLKYMVTLFHIHVGLRRKFSD